VLDIRGLRKVYDGHGRQVEALRNITFQVDGGEFVCVVGPSGCGKTNPVAHHRRAAGADVGHVTVGGQLVSGPPDQLAVVFQEYGRSLFPWLKVHENVELPLKAKGTPKARRADLSTRRSRRWAYRALAPRGRGSCRAACSSGSRSPGPSPTSHGSC
jgi:NitT/TauT family transport system ATP-binding protein